MTPVALLQLFPADLWRGDFAHGVRERQAEHLDEEVDGISGHVALGPAPVTFFYDETGISGQLEITCFFGRKTQVPFL